MKSKVIKSTTVNTYGEQKSKLVAVLLAFFLCGIWALVNFIRLLTGSLNTDANGVELKKF
ncbi:MAG: hypothetical protein IJE46_05980 [Clostridia bacterium]|nr:hypothetical protein [Clostridia bacterium]